MEESNLGLPNNENIQDITDIGAKDEFQIQPNNVPSQPINPPMEPIPCQLADQTICYPEEAQQANAIPNAQAKRVRKQRSTYDASTGKDATPKPVPEDI